MNFDARGESRKEYTDGQIRMPFGKYKDKTLKEIPDSYLLWVLDNVDMDNRPTLLEAIRQRLGLGQRDGSRGSDELEATIKAWFRTLALDFHPDRRGSHEAMIAINEAHHRLRRMLRL